MRLDKMFAVPNSGRLALFIYKVWPNFLENPVRCQAEPKVYLENVSTRHRHCCVTIGSAEIRGQPKTHHIIIGIQRVFSAPDTLSDALYSIRWHGMNI